LAGDDSRVLLRRQAGPRQIPAREPHQFLLYRAAEFVHK
jgi:hypothetical protein